MMIRVIISLNPFLLIYQCSNCGAGLLLSLGCVEELSVFEDCADGIREDSVQVLLGLGTALNVVEKVVMLDSFETLKYKFAVVLFLTSD